MDVQTAKLLIGMQMKRATLASEWRSSFTDLLKGNKTADEYSLHTMKIVIPQAQSISGEFMKMREQAVIVGGGKTDCDGEPVKQGEDGEGEKKEPSADKKKFGISANIRDTITELQEAEKGLFNATLKFQQELIAHLTTKEARGQHYTDCALLPKINQEHYKLDVLSGTASEAAMDDVTSSDEEGTEDNERISKPQCIAVGKTLDALKVEMLRYEETCSDLVEELTAEIADAQSS